MISKPSLEQLRKKDYIRFNIVIAVAKRARQIQAGYEPFYKGPEKNPLTIATKEIEQGSVKCISVNNYGVKA